MHITFYGNRISIKKAASEPKLYNDSRVFHLLKVALQAMGFDVIKKVMTKDGHMVSEGQHYLRSRLTSDKKYFCIYDQNYQIRAMHDVWNQGSEIRLEVGSAQNLKPTLWRGIGGEFSIGISRDPKRVKFSSDPDCIPPEVALVNASPGLTPMVFFSQLRAYKKDGYSIEAEMDNFTIMDLVI